MTTNPDNAVGTNAAYGGRTSVNAFNDDLSAYTRGILSGWECTPSSGLTVVLGGSGNTRDVAIAEDNSGNKTTVNNISGSPISITLDAAPGNNTRIDSIVAYVDSSPQGSATIVDNYEACGLIAVAGSPSSSPVAPDESAIRTAITADGASGTTAYYVVLATVTIASGTTDITSNNITAGVNAMIQARNIPITYDIIGATTGDFNYAIKYSDGRLTCYQRYTAASKTTSSWGQVYSADSAITLKDYAVSFIQSPAISASPSGLGSSGMNFWLSTDGGQAGLTRPPRFQVSRGTSGNIGGAKIDIIAEGFWK